MTQSPSLDFSQDFLNRLYKAYARRGRHGDDMMLGDVQRDVWEDLQPRSFWAKYNLDLATQYTTDEFSADISSQAGVMLIVVKRE